MTNSVVNQDRIEHAPDKRTEGSTEESCDPMPSSRSPKLSFAPACHIGSTQRHQRKRNADDRQQCQNTEHQAAHRFLHHRQFRSWTIRFNFHFSLNSALSNAFVTEL